VTKHCLRTEGKQFGHKSAALLCISGLVNIINLLKLSHVLLADQIEGQEKVLSNARKQFRMEDIDADDFKAVKSGCTGSLRILEAKVSDLPNKADNIKPIEACWILLY
jgi:hypothetical protein